MQQLEAWRRYLQERDRSPGTVEKYVEAVARSLAGDEQEEGAPLQLEVLTPIALIGYRNHLQHEQQKSGSNIILRISALLRLDLGWCVAANSTLTILVVSQIATLSAETLVPGLPTRSFSFLLVLIWA